MLGETEEYEPLSRAAYYKAMRENRQETTNETSE
jgi:thymidine kinase